MQRYHTNERDETEAATPSEPQKEQLDHHGILASERIDEVLMLCDRNHPLYEQVSSFSVALYVLGFFDCSDFMSFHDVLVFEAAEILREEYSPVDFDDIEDDYRLSKSRERYLLVVGDPLFPVHFAVLVNKGAIRPYFSKLPLFGAGYDSLEELVTEFCGKEGVKSEDFHYYRKSSPKSSFRFPTGIIYIVNK
ncbi:MAG: hypothetical protein OEL83_07940 [Desulforhopalus sp.]|nr:hypothetical protein [Desulforhopalus sp.]